MKVYKSEIVFPIRFENSLVAKPHNCLAPLLALAGARGGGDEGGAALVRAGVKQPNSPARANPSPPTPLPEAGRGELKGQ
jgi:hypothetical protein